MVINVGPVEILDPVILAPMSGVTDMPFRRLVKKFGAGLVVSEMIASEAMIRCKKQVMKMSTNCADEHPMAVQLAGFKPETMYEAARLNEDRGAAIIDINMGCPVKKVVNGHAGSALMRDLEHAQKIIAATVKAVSIPVTLKMRTGWADTHRNAPELAKIAESEGIKLITVHGRTRNQFYKGKADWAFVNEVKKAVDVPVIVNGDIVDFDSITTSLEQSKADGVMIGRGTYGRPWLIAQAMEYLKSGEKIDSPTLAVQLETILEHYEDMLHHYGVEGGVKIARKHFGWYTKGLHESAEFRQKVNHMNNPEDVKEALKGFYLPLIDLEAA